LPAVYRKASSLFTIHITGICEDPPSGGEAESIVWRELLSGRLAAERLEA